MIRLSISSLLLLLSVSAFAQKKSLEECVRLAWENNISVQQSMLMGANARIDLDQAKASRYPNLNAGTSLNISGRSVDPTNNQFAANGFFTNNYNLSSNVILYNGGRIRKNIERAQLSEDAATWMLEDTKQNIALQVSNAYLTVLFNQENVAIANQRLSISQSQKNQMERLIEAGLRPKNDIYELEATVANNEQALVTAEGNLAISRLQLNQLMLISAEDKFDLEIPEVLLAELEDPFLLDPESLFKRAEQNQPSLKNADIQKRIAELDKKIAKAAYQPTMGIGGSVGTNYSSLGRRVNGEEEIIVDQDIILNGNTTTIGVSRTVPVLEDNPYFAQIGQNITYGYGLSLSVPIYNNKQISSGVSRAEINLKNAELSQKQANIQFRSQIEQAVLDARNAKKQYDAALKSVEASERSLENLRKSFEVGGTNTFELNIATNQYDTALLQSIISKYDYIFRMKIIDFYLGKPLNF